MSLDLLNQIQLFLGLETSEENVGTNNESTSLVSSVLQNLVNDSITNRLVISQENILETQDATTSVTVKNFYNTSV